MNFNKNKCFAKCAAVAMAVGMMLPTSAMAADINAAGSTGSVPVNMTAEAATFSVTVPTALPVNVDAAGVHTAGDAVYITNKSHGPVKVSAVAINGDGGWATANYDSDMTAEKVNAKKIGIELGVQGQTLGKTGADGAYQFDASNWPTINGVTSNNAADGAQKQQLEYHTKAPAQITGLNNETVANVVFTIGWDVQA